MSQEVTGGALPSPQDLGFRLDHPRNQQNHKRMTYNDIYKFNDPWIFWYIYVDPAAS